MSVFFTKQLLKWHKENPRPLPWDDGPRDAYHIWISEIIMQQTRIEQGAPFYKKFISRFPNVESLALAPADEILRYWQGLGYYSRARNLHKAAQFIFHHHAGTFPDSYPGLLDLPGIGPYSAAAIASFAYGLPYPVVDGNVKRLISRFAGIESSIDSAHTHEQIRMLASSYIKGADPAVFNQAIMNFGAMVCKPKAPLCENCPLSKKCFAFLNDKAAILPLRSKKKTNAYRYFHFVIFHYRGKILLQRREHKDIWRGLYAPPEIITTSERSPARSRITALTHKLLGVKAIEHMTSSPVVEQLLSHQTIRGRFHHVRLLSPPVFLPEFSVWVNTKNIGDYAKPKLVINLLKEAR